MDKIFKFLASFIAKHTNQCWFQHFTAGSIVGALCKVLVMVGFGALVPPVGVALILVQFYKSFWYDPDMGVHDIREQLGDFFSTIIGFSLALFCVFG